MVIYDSSEYDPERADTIIERARSLAVYFSEHLPECGAQHPEGKYNVFDNSVWYFVSIAIVAFQFLRNLFIFSQSSIMLRNTSTNLSGNTIRHPLADGFPRGMSSRFIIIAI
jgi:hypothetical protein